MKEWIKKYIWVILACSFSLVVVDLFSNIVNFVFFIVSIILMVSVIFISHPLLKRILFLVGLFTLSNVLINSYAFVGFILVVVLLIAVFQTKEGNELIWFNEGKIHPFKRKKEYIGVKLVRPQIEQRSLIYKQSITKNITEREIFEWDDINIIAIGGDSIIDLDATIFPDGESVVFIRKMFGRTRVILPHDVGLKMNITLINGRVVYEQDVFPLLNDCFLWESKDYNKNSRKVKVMISSVFGDVEVIRL